MTEKERNDILFEATGGIADSYLEEAAARPKRNRFIQLTAAAAVLVLLIGAAVMFWPEQMDTTPVPFFAIRVYAADGSAAMLDAFGDTARLKSGTSDMFPGKEVYTLDVSLEGYTGDPTDLTSGNFRFIHKQKLLKPGESDEYLSVEWLTKEEDGFFGYRIIGWCDGYDTISLTIYDEADKVLHQKEVIVTHDNGYTADVRISYTYHEGLSTDELIDLCLQQDYTIDCILSSNLTQHHLLNDTGFRELTERPDAASKLLERYVRIMNGETLYPITGGHFADAFENLSNDYLVGAILSWDEFWDQLTLEEKELFASYGMWRTLGEEEGYYRFSYNILMDGKNLEVMKMTVSYNGNSITKTDENVRIARVITMENQQEKQLGWSIEGHFEEPTEVTMTVTDQDGTLIRRDVILVTPTEAGYQIDVLETTE